MFLTDLLGYHLLSISIHLCFLPLELSTNIIDINVLGNYISRFRKAQWGKIESNYLSFKYLKKRSTKPKIKHSSIIHKFNVVFRCGRGYISKGVLPHTFKLGLWFQFLQVIKFLLSELCIKLNGFSKFCGQKLDLDSRPVCAPIGRFFSHLIRKTKPKKSFGQGNIQIFR